MAVDSTQQTILTALLEIKQEIGSIKSDTETTKELLANHVSDDRAVEGRVAKLEAVHNINRGSARVWSLVGTAVGSLLGFLVSALFGRN